MPTSTVGNGLVNWPLAAQRRLGFDDLAFFLSEIWFDTLVPAINVAYWLTNKIKKHDIISRLLTHPAFVLLFGVDLLDHN